MRIHRLYCTSSNRIPDVANLSYGLSFPDKISLYVEVKVFSLLPKRQVVNLINLL